MSILDVPKDSRRQYIASLLGYDPSKPETWGDMIIDTVIKHVDEAAERRLQEIIRELTYNPPRRNHRS